MQRRSLLTLGALVALAGCAGDDDLDDLTGDDSDDSQPAADDDADAEDADADDDDAGETDPLDESVDRSAIRDQTAEALAQESFELQHTVTEFDESHQVAFEQTIQMRGDPTASEIVGYFAAAERPIDGPTEHAPANGGIYIDADGVTEWEIGEDTGNRLTEGDMDFDEQVEQLDSELDSLYEEAQMLEFGEPTDANGQISIPIIGVDDDEDDARDMTIHEGSLSVDEDDTLAGFSVEAETSTSHLGLSVDTTFGETEDVGEPDWLDDEIKAEFEALEALQEEINDLERASDPRLAHDLERLEDDREQFEAEYEQLQDNIEQLEDDRDELETELADIDEELDATEQELVETEQALHEAETAEEQEQYYQKLAELEADLDQLMHDQHQVRSQLDAIEGEIHHFEQQIEGIQSHIDQVDDQIDQIEEELDELPDPEEAEEELAELTEEFEERREELHEELVGT